MASFHGIRVSTDWRAILTYIESELRIHVPLNSGQRTMAEQTALRRCWERKCKGPGTPLAAVPSCSAPHIDCDHESHALDIACDAEDQKGYHGQHGRVLHAMRGLGLHPVHTVRGECWHVEVPEAEVKLVADRIRRIRGERARYGRIRTAILRRRRKGLASPGQRKLLGKVRDNIARIRKVL